MAVQKIEQYRQQNGVDILKVFTKPTKAFPGGGYFYAPSEAIDLIKSYTWRLSKHENEVEVIATNSFDETLRFHRELCYFYHSQYVPYIDHIDGVELDNIDQNLNVVTNQQNTLNKFTRGYLIIQRGSKITFRPGIKFLGKNYRPYGYLPTEVEACRLQYIVDTDYLHSLMGDQYYQFDFKRYRRGSEDILDLERTGKISEEEATYRHVLKYANNAWFMHRYNLEDYFRHYHIPIPSYSLDEFGLMTHPITGKILCPFDYKPKY